jgi:uncharacterized protein (DUF2249 family)
MSSKKPVTLDVREDIRRGREPFSRIMQATAALGNDQSLLLLAPFEPVPLYAVLQSQGFSHESRELDSGDWEVRFFREKPEESNGKRNQSAQANSPKSAPKGYVDLDTRGLEPPEPLVKILEALPSLPEGGVIRAFTDRRPMHLYAQLEQRGYSGKTLQQPDGSFVTHVRRA